MGSARSLQCEWILGETTYLHCPALPSEVLEALRNFFMENCGLVREGGGNGHLPIASLACWEKQPAQFWVREDPSAQMEVHVCASCPAGCGSGADSYFLHPSVYLYVFG